MARSEAVVCMTRGEATRRNASAASLASSAAGVVSGSSTSEPAAREACSALKAAWYDHSGEEETSVESGVRRARRGRAEDGERSTGA